MKTASAFNSRFSHFIREPYRVFFPLGVLMGLAGVLQWLLFAAGYLTYYPGVHHAALLTEAFMGFFIAGFLTTAFPRFTASETCRGTEFFLLLFMILACAGFHLIGNERAGRACYAGWILILLVFAARRITAKKTSSSGRPAVSPPVEMVWVGTGLFHAASGWLMFEAGRAGWVSYAWMDAGRRLSDQGFLLCVVLGVGGFLAPRLMGTFRLQPASPGAKKAGSVRAGALTLHLLCGLAVFISFLLEGAGRLRAAYFLRAAAAAVPALYTGALALRPRVRETYVWGVWFSFWLMAAGLWGCAFQPAHRVEWLHLVFLGGYSLMTFSVAAMVILSHAGHAERLRKPMIFLRIIYGGIFLSLVFRLLAPFFPEHYLRLLAASSTVWAAGAVFWLAILIPFLFQFTDEGSREKMHEEMKKQILAKRDCCHGDEEKKGFMPKREG